MAAASRQGARRSSSGFSSGASMSLEDKAAARAAQNRAEDAERNEQEASNSQGSTRLLGDTAVSWGGEESQGDTGASWGSEDSNVIQVAHNEDQDAGAFGGGNQNLLQVADEDGAQQGAQVTFSTLHAAAMENEATSGGMERGEIVSADGTDRLEPYGDLSELGDDIITADGKEYYSTGDAATDLAQQVDDRNRF